jgi:hypothetical protein
MGPTQAVKTVQSAVSQRGQLCLRQCTESPRKDVLAHQEAKLRSVVLQLQKSLARPFTARAAPFEMPVAEPVVGPPPPWTATRAAEGRAGREGCRHCKALAEKSSHFRPLTFQGFSAKCLPAG